jgi:hypothetical protein
VNAPTPLVQFETPEDRRVDALLAFVARVEARAILWQAGELGLHEAVDELQFAAEDDGVVGRIGQDAVQAIMGHAFDAVCQSDFDKEGST